MGKKTAWISFIMLIIFVVTGFMIINVRLNRRIYSDIILAINDKEEKSNNEKGVWNLDYMEEVLNNAESYKDKGEGNLKIFDDLDEIDKITEEVFAQDGSEEFSFNSVPTIRVLFNRNPFDLRISLEKYIVTFNKESLNKLLTLEKLKDK